MVILGAYFVKNDNKQETVVSQHVVDTRTSRTSSTLNVKHTHPDEVSQQEKKRTLKPTTKKTTTKQPIPTRLDPTRYGDWEKNGRCIDF